MPRKRKPAQSPPTGLPYGDGQKMADAQRAIPVAAAPTPSVPAGGGGTSPAGTPAVDPMAAALAAAQQMAPVGGLAAPSARAGEPVTTGLPVGPGRGPEAVPMPAFDRDDDVLLDLVNANRIARSPALTRIIELHRNRTVARHSTLDAGRAVRRPRY